MPRLLAILLILATPALAQETRPLFPDDFKPHACAEAAPLGKSFRQSQFAAVAGLRGYDIGQEWADANWQKITDAIQPSFAKIATCFAMNASTFCNDVVSEDVYSNVCKRLYSADSKDLEKCELFVRIYMTGHDRQSREPWTKIQECAKAQPAAGERTLEWWMVPDNFGPGFKNNFRVFAIDAETRVPVEAFVRMDVKPRVTSDVPGGEPSTFYRIFWKPKLVRIPNAEGHRDVGPPEVRLEAAGYKTVSFRLPVAVPKMTVKMDPAPLKLKRGKNTVTITAVDVASGEPIEARVMGGDTVLGKTNEPFELEIVKGQKRPEIWVTSLFDRYSDFVVAPAEK